MGYLFQGFYTENDKAYSIQDALDEEYYLAKWAAVQYEFVYENEDGSALYTQTLTYDVPEAMKTADELGLSNPGFYLLWQDADGNLYDPEENSLLNLSDENGGSVSYRVYWEKDPTILYEVTSYHGVYDQQPHQIQITPQISDTSIMYSTDGENYSEENPQFTNAGTYSVSYMLEAEGYTSVYGTACVQIDKAVPLTTLTAGEGFIGVSSTSTDSYVITAQSSNNEIATCQVGNTGSGSNVEIPENPVRIYPTILGESGTITCSVYTEESDNYYASEVVTMDAYVGPEQNLNTNTQTPGQYVFNTNYGWFYGLEQDGAWNASLQWIAYDSDQWLTSQPITLSAGTYYVENYTGGGPRDVCWNTFGITSPYCIFSANNGYMLHLEGTKYLQLTAYTESVYRGVNTVANHSPNYYALNPDRTGKYMTVRQVIVDPS